MADNDFIPPPPRNGGTGSPEVGNIRAPDYRQLQNPAQVRTDLPSSGAAERAAELGRVFKEFSGEAINVSDTLGTQAGAIAGAAAGATGHPQYRQGLERFSAYSQAFNNAATGAYAIQAEAFADDTAARLRVEANNDPAHFATTFSAVRDAVVKQAPPQAQAMLTELYNKHLANGIAAISGDQATEIRNTQRNAYDVGVQRQTSRVARLQGSANPADQAAGDDEQAKLSALIEGGVNSGLYSKAEAEAMHINAARTVTAQIFQTQFDSILSGERTTASGNTGALGAVDLLDNFQKAHLANLADKNATPILSEPEYQKLYADGVTKLREYNLGIAAIKRGDKTAEELKFEAGDTQYTTALLSGTLTERDLAAAVRNGDLKPERATGLRQLLLQGPATVKSSPEAVLRLHTDPHFLDMTADELAKVPGVSPADQLKAYDEIVRRRGSWEGTQNVKQAKFAIGVALKIPPGTPTAAMSDEQRKAYSDAVLDFTNRMNLVQPSQRDSSAASVAQEVVKDSMKKQAAAEITDLTNAKQSYIQRSGPASNSPAPDEAYKQRLQHYDDLIKQQQAVAQGK